MAMNEEKTILIKLTIEEAKTVNEVLAAFAKLSKIAPVKGEKRKSMKLAVEGINGIMDKINDVIKKEEKKKENSEE